MLIIAQCSLCSLFVQLSELLIVNCFTRQQKGDENINRVNILASLWCCSAAAQSTFSLGSCGLWRKLNNLPLLHLCRCQPPPGHLQTRSHRSHCVQNPPNFVSSSVSCLTFSRREREIFCEVKTFSAHGHARSIHRTLLHQEGLAQLKPRVCSAGPGSATLNYRSDGQIVFTPRQAHFHF